MALRRQNLSPTASLLRGSRLFSLPNPLPRPSVGETYGAGLSKVSDTATLPYPTHQAIATTPSSLARGDWGLKRPLPSRSHIVQTSNPVLRIKQLDTIEHVTDFESAADHVRTRQKWEEMSIPIMKGVGAMKDRGIASGTPPGAFEKRADVTSYDTDEGLDEAGLYLEAIRQNMKKNAAGQARARKAQKKDPNAPAASFTPFVPPQPDPAVRNARRWKHQGPWLPGMSAEEFVEYLTKEISKRRNEFNQYLVEFVRNEIYTTRKLTTSSSGSMPLDDAEAQEWHAQQEAQWSDITKADIDAGIKALRRETANNPLQSKLVTKLILPFLRLPAINFKNTAFSVDATTRDFDAYEFDDETAPLSTHPSAGLGYLRTKSYLANHPLLGPQSKATPVAARVVQPRSTATTTEPYARLGIAGFITNDEHRSTGPRHNWASKDIAEAIDVHTHGGAKIQVNPQYAAVTNDGRIHIKVTRSGDAEIKVGRGELEDRPPERQNVQRNLQINLKNMGQSGIKELDEHSAQARQFDRVMGQQMKKNNQIQQEQPSEEEFLQGLAEAVRGDPKARR